MARYLVTGAGGFIGNVLVKYLKASGHYVEGIDIKLPQFSDSMADRFHLADVRRYNEIDAICGEGWHGVFHLAANMGGAEFVFTGTNDFEILTDSLQMNIALAQAVKHHGIPRVVYTSSACVYPEHNQLNANQPITKESSAYPADPDSNYGWEKLTGERIWQALGTNHSVDAKIVRLHNVFGPLGTWQGGREKAPAAICRKVAQATDSIEIFGDGAQTRSFLWVGECVDGLLRMMESDCQGPVNLGSQQMISINQLVDMVCEIAGKTLEKKHIAGPLGVRGRTSDNTLIKQQLGWAPREMLRHGLTQTYQWISEQLMISNKQSSKS